MGVKQDRGRLRSEQPDRSYAALAAMIEKQRDHVDSVESSVRNELKEQYSTLSRNSEEIRLSVSETTETIEHLSDRVEVIENIEGLFFYIMYSEYEDGRDMVSESTERTIYMGTCSTNQSTAPTDPAEYTWFKTRGENGQDAILLMIDSSAGNLFKNASIATTLTVTIIVGDITITDSARLYAVFGSSAKLIWRQMNMGETEYTDIDSEDPRLSDNGFMFTLNANDVSTKAIFNCVLDF